MSSDRRIYGFYIYQKLNHKYLNYLLNFEIVGQTPFLILFLQKTKGIATLFLHIILPISTDSIGGTTAYPLRVSTFDHQ